MYLLSAVPKGQSIEQAHGQILSILRKHVRDLPTFIGWCSVVSNETGVQRGTTLSVAFENLGLWMPLIRASYALLFGNTLSQTTGMSLIEDMYQCECHAISDCPTFLHLFSMQHRCSAWQALYCLHRCTDRRSTA
jgi:hypothetical protein